MIYNLTMQRGRTEKHQGRCYNKEVPIFTKSKIFPQHISRNMNRMQLHTLPLNQLTTVVRGYRVLSSTKQNFLENHHEKYGYQEADFFMSVQILFNLDTTTYKGRQMLTLMPTDATGEDMILHTYFLKNNIFYFSPHKLSFIII